MSLCGGLGFAQTVEQSDLKGGNWKDAQLFSGFSLTTTCLFLCLLCEDNLFIRIMCVDGEIIFQHST